MTAMGKAIRKLRRDRDMRQVDVAERLGCSVVFVSAMEKGKKKVPIKYLPCMALALNLTNVEMGKLYTIAAQTLLDGFSEEIRAAMREILLAGDRS